MNTAFEHLLPTNFSDQSRIWVYQANRIFSLSEALQLENELDQFVNDWRSHGAPVKAKAFLFFGQFIILMADETQVTVGGCSTDSSVHLIKEIEKKYKVNLLDRTQLAFIVKGKVQLLPLAQLSYAVEQKFIDEETLYFNNIVSTKKELIQQWIVPIKSSWLKQKISFT